MRAKRIILATGSRAVDNFHDACMRVYSWLEFETTLFGRENVLVVHGAAEGWDRVYHVVAQRLGVHVRPVPADGYETPLVRNEAMVAFVGALSTKYVTKPACWAHAHDWRSGTGHCARRARQAGIPTTDYGVPTE